MKKPLSSTIIYGQRAVSDAIANGTPLTKLYLAPGIKFAPPAKCELVIKNRQALDELTRGANHQGVVAQIAEFSYTPLSNLLMARPRLVLVLDHIEDPQNLGAIIRTANAAGLTHLIIPSDRAAQISPAVYKVASGGLAKMAVVRVNALVPALNELKAAGYWLYASALSSDAIDYLAAPLNAPLALIVGNEHRGVSPTLSKMADVVTSITQYGSVQSLNVSVATGILLFSFLARLAKT